MDLNLQIVAQDYHRNGVGGAPFKVALVHDESERDVKLVIMFEQEGHTAVLSLEKLLHHSDIAFGSNSYRGDVYESMLRSKLWKDEE